MNHIVSSGHFSRALMLTFAVGTILGIYLGVRFS